MQLDVTAIDYDFPPNIKIDKRWPGADNIISISKISQDHSKQDAKKPKVEEPVGSDENIIDDGLPQFSEDKIGFEKPERVCMDLLKQQDKMVEEMAALEEKKALQDTQQKY